MNTTTDKFAVEAEFGGMFRVTHYRNGSMVNRRRDVSPQRVEAVKEAMLRETKDAS